MSFQNDPQRRVRRSCATPLQSSSVASLCHPSPTHPRALSVLASALALSVVLAALPGTALAGAWTQPQGDTLVIVKALHSDGRGWFDDGHHRTTFGDGQQFDGNGRSRQDQLNVYVEHGLTEKLSFIGNFYFSDVGFSNHDAVNGRQQTTTTGFADQEIGLRYALPSAQNDVWRSAVQALVSVPAYGRSKTYHPNNPSANSDPALGLGDYGLELRYSRGRGYTLGGRNGYVDLGGGGPPARKRGVGRTAGGRVHRSESDPELAAIGRTQRDPGVGQRAWQRRCCR
ncbi:Putative secreted protein (fragment) [Xanthomonas phaseoli pv. phaseoli]